MQDNSNLIKPHKALTDLINPSNLMELEATYNSAGGILLVAYLKYRVEFLSQELFSKPSKMVNDEKIEYLSMINAYIDVLDLVQTLKTMAKKKQEEQEKLNRRAVESGGVSHGMVR